MEPPTKLALRLDIFIEILPRTRVNKGEKDKKGPGIVTQILASSKRHQVGLRKLEEPKASPVLLCLSSNG
jgi:hypothetical protein